MFTLGLINERSGECRIDPVLQDQSHVDLVGSEHPLHLNAVHQRDQFHCQGLRICAVDQRPAGLQSTQGLFKACA